MGEIYLLDVNVMIALANEEHEHHEKAENWFQSLGPSGWGPCPLTEAGFARFTMNPAMGPMFSTFPKVIAFLKEFATRPGYRYWPLTESWALLIAPFASRISGHQQVTDAYLLGLAIKENGVLVTFDKSMKYLAGPDFSRNLLILE